MEYREAAIEDYGLKVEIRVIPPSETSEFFSEYKMPEGPLTSRIRYEDFLLRKVVKDYYNLLDNVLNALTAEDNAYIRWMLLQEIYKANERLDPTQVLIVKVAIEGKSKKIFTSKLLSRFDQNIVNLGPRSIRDLTENVDWRTFKPNSDLIKMWFKKYCDSFNKYYSEPPRELPSVPREFETIHMDDLNVDMPFPKIPISRNVLGNFITRRHQSIVQHARLDFSGWMQHVIETAIWRYREVEDILMKAEFSKSSLYTIRLILYKSACEVNPHLQWENLMWDKLPFGNLLDNITSAYKPPSMLSEEHIQAQALSDVDPLLLYELEERLGEKIKGQPHVLKSLAKAILRASVGFGRERQKPIGVFMFTGPTGVGKTETAKALAEQLTGKRPVLVSCTEYSQGHEVAKLIGAPPGYVGFEDLKSEEAPRTLATIIKENPFSVVLFDELEKAHNSLFNVLFRVFDEGTLTTGRGDEVVFKDTIIILTSNIGMQEAQFAIDRKSLGFTAREHHEDRATLQAAQIQQAIKQLFSPEFQKQTNGNSYIRASWPRRL